MSLFLPLHKKRGLRAQASQRSFALVITLGMVAIATILLILFVTAMSLDRSASSSYSQSVKAQEIGLGGLHLVVGQLQAEMSKDALPDTNSSPTAVSIFTNVSPYNIAPQANVTNSALPILVKMSTNAPFYSGTNSISVFQATTNSTTASSYNGRSVSTTRWNQAYFGTYPNPASAPYWILMTRSGPTNATGISPLFGATSANTLNNPTIGNTNYVIGRIAYAVYDESGLLDINAAGYDTSIVTNAAAAVPIKGTLAGADLTQIGIDPTKFVAWRNAASDTSANNYYNYVTNYASTNGFQSVYPGDTTFLSRQDLIAAAQNTATTGISTSALTNLTTFTRELNAPSWAPTPTSPVSATAKYKYTANALSLTTGSFTLGSPNPNPFIPLVRYSTGGTVTGYLTSGGTFTYTVNAGDPVVQHRFPLDRLNWVTPKGPSASLTTTDPFYNPGGTAAAIQACFGLIWGASENKNSDANWSSINVWKYVGSTGSATTELISSTASASIVKTLSGVASESSPREPNFFELLQAGVLSGSLGLNTGGSQNLYSSGENYVTLHLLRIGANMIAQVQPQAYPINIEYNQNDLGNYSMVASGIANLPYINMVKFITGQSQSDNGTGGKHQMGVYGLVQLWNPNQQPATAVTRPSIALFIQGSISVGSGWSYNEGGYSTTTPLETASGTLTTAVYGASYTLNANTYYLPLSNASGVGANGFLNPYPITSADMGTPAPSVGSNTQLGWTSNTGSFVISSTDPEYAYFNQKNITYAGFELPDLAINLGLTGPNKPLYLSTSADDDHNIVWLGNVPNANVTGLSKFQLILKYKDSSGNWVPYDYWYGDNASVSWANTTGLRDAYYGSPITSTTAPPTLEQTLHSITSHSADLMTTDPRTMRFGTFPFSGDNNAGIGVIANPMIDSLWSGSLSGTAVTTAPFNVSGYANCPGSLVGIPGEGGNFPASFGGFFAPADLCRNNHVNVNGGSNAGAYFSAYSDTLDGIQRIGDSGLFPTSTTATPPFPFTASPTTGNPYYDPYNTPTLTGTVTSRTADRPIILNRPFNSVGELGYVYRDAPWRSLDFFSVYSPSGTAYSTSADSGLLDLFCVTDSPNSVVAGRVNLNTKNNLVLQAILSNTMANVGDTGNNPTVTTVGNPSGMASTLTAYTSASPANVLVNKDQLVTKFGVSLGSGTTVNSAFLNADEQNVKPYREAFIRSLADVGQTRTWNLMIDLVAQAGKYYGQQYLLYGYDHDQRRHDQSWQLQCLGLGRNQS